MTKLSSYSTRNGNGNGASHDEPLCRPDANDRRQTYTTGQIARLLHVAPRLVSKWIDSGRLRGYRLPDSADRRVHYDALYQFMLDSGMPLDLLCGPGRQSLLLITQDTSLADAVRIELADMEVAHVACWFDAGRVFDTRPWCAVVLDHAMGRPQALVTHRYVRCHLPGAKVISLINEDDASDYSEELGANPVWQRPCDLTAFVLAIAGKLGRVKA